MDGYEDCPTIANQFLEPLSQMKTPDMNNSSRRQFLQAAGSLAAVPVLASGFQSFAEEKAAQEKPKARKKPLFRISLAQWSLHKALKAGEMDNLDFAKVAKQELGISAVEYVNQFFKDKANNKEYLADMKTRAKDNGVKSLLIMVDGEGRLGDPNENKRREAVEKHFKWVEAAKFLGCHSIRVNASSSGSFEDQQELAADGLRQLSEFGDQHGINVIVENHGGLSSNGTWLAGVMAKVDHARCGTLPDFGNFTINYGTGEMYDRYQGTHQLMPFAKGVSFKSYEFDDKYPLCSLSKRIKGVTHKLDYEYLMSIVLDHGYRGHVGIEYEGHELDEIEGIKKSKQILMKVRNRLSKTYDA